MGTNTMSETFYKAFYSGDTVRVTAHHRDNYGLRGRVDKWVHGDFYLVTLENNKQVVLTCDEIDHLIYLPEESTNDI